MSWNNKDGEGPWGSKKDNQNNRSWESNFKSPNDIEKFFKKGKQSFNKMVPPGGVNIFSFLLLGIIFVVWLLSGIYRVKEGEQGVELRFGKLTNITQPGLHYHIPYPIETVITKKVAMVNKIDIGNLEGVLSPEEQEIFMLTSDENILDINLTIFWFIKDVRKFLFRTSNPEQTVKTAGESAVREVIARTPMELALTKGKSEIAHQLQELLQKIVDEYEIGIQIQKVELQKVEAPAPVLGAFRDVQSARADEERLVNEAKGYRDSVIPRAQAKSAEIIQKAMGYKKAVIADAEGRAERFLSIYQNYIIAPTITMRRMHLEKIAKIMKNVNKVLIEGKVNKGQGVVPYLPLPELKAVREQKPETNQ